MEQKANLNYDPGATNSFFAFTACTGGNVFFSTTFSTGFFTCPSPGWVIFEGLGVSACALSNRCTNPSTIEAAAAPAAIFRAVPDVDGVPSPYRALRIFNEFFSWMRYTTFRTSSSR